jgi:hypothetical protein
MMMTMARPSRSAVDVLPEDDKLGVDSAELVEHFEEVLDLPGQPIRSPDQDYIDNPAAGIGHHCIQTRPLCLRAADPIGVLMNAIS